MVFKVNESEGADNYDFFIKSGNTSPAFATVLRDRNEDRVNINDATVKFRMEEIGSGSLEVDEFATILDPINGEVAYEWESSDTDNIGDFVGEFDVDFDGGYGSNFDGDRTFPINGFISIRIEPDV